MKNIDSNLLKNLNEKFKSQDNKSVLLHFVPNILSPGCSAEIKDLKEKYLESDAIELVIVSCSNELDISQWIKNNQISWRVYKDEDRDLTKGFDCLNTQYNVPTRYTALVSNEANIVWEIDYPLEKNRDILLYNEYNKEYLNK